MVFRQRLFVLLGLVFGGTGAVVDFVVPLPLRRPRLVGGGWLAFQRIVVFIVGLVVELTGSGKRLEPEGRWTRCRCST